MLYILHGGEWPWNVNIQEGRRSMTRSSVHGHQFWRGDFSISYLTFSVVCKLGQSKKKKMPKPNCEHSSLKLCMYTYWLMPLVWGPPRSRELDHFPVSLKGTCWSDKCELLPHLCTLSTTGLTGMEWRRFNCHYCAITNFWRDWIPF